MKIVERGNYKNVFPIKVKCERIEDIYGFAYGKTPDFCGSVLEIENSDIKKHKWEKYPDFSGTDYGVICPICKRFIVIDKEKIPEYILKNADETSVTN